MNNGFYDVIAIPVINGLVEMAKLAGLQKRFCPILAVLLGVVMGVYISAPHEPLPMAVLRGVIIGLSAVGLYSGGRNVLRWDELIVEKSGKKIK